MIGTGGLTFLFLDEADTLNALVARVVPGSDGDPGAQEMGVVTYIDRALSGAYREYQHAYRTAIRALNAFVRQEFGATFFELDAADQDAIIGRLEKGDASGIDAADGRDFFMMVWAHTVEGMLSDPTYGGNRDAAGWRLIGFPGAHYGYTAEDMRYGKDLTTKPMVTLTEIQTLAREQPELFFHRTGPTSPAAPAATPPAETTGEAPVLQGASPTDSNGRSQ